MGRNVRLFGRARNESTDHISTRYDRQFDMWALRF